MTQAKERPILFSAPMVRAILEGRKTQTRRIVKSPKSFSPTAVFNHIDCVGQAVFIDGTAIACPYGQKGDRLWVRETWAADMGEVIYRADGIWDDNKSINWKPSIHMPRKHSRITLEVVNVRVERLQDISEGDAIAEGVERNGGEWKCYGNCPDHATGHDKRTSATASFMSLWESINGKGSWDLNPWVWCVEFKQVEVAK